MISKKEEFSKVDDKSQGASHSPLAQKEYSVYQLAVKVSLNSI